MYLNLNNFKIIKSILLLFIISAGPLFSQGDVNIPADEPFGDPNWNFKGRMNGNRVFETFKNHGEMGNWNSSRQNQDDSDWPAGGLRNPYLDGVGLIVGGSVLDTLGNRVQMTSSHYREEVDRSPDLETIWGWHPIPGYLNFDRINTVGTAEPVPAMSNDESSWPDIWLDQPDYFDEDGELEWNGRFGQGKFNAQLEAYYVMDDAIDHEFGYVPVAAQPDRGGLGLRTSVRLYQWVHPLAQDVIFAEFNVTNLGDQEIDSTGFGWWTDNGIGNNPPDNGLFAAGEGERDFDLAIGYNEGSPGLDMNGLPTGIAGYAFLESPGIANDAIDNDADGMQDERRDNDAGTFYEDGLSDPRIVDANNFFLEFGRQPGPHWEGDEDGDWVGFEDLNGNNTYDFGESINNDVGTDGVAPGDLNYFGPDADGTEGNGQPDQGEPNFGRTDKDESDQLGMTYFKMIEVPDHPNPQPNRFQKDWFSDDETWWGWLSADTIVTAEASGNLVMIFASGTFPLASLRTERFSMIIARTVGSENNISEMIELKETVQAIYNTDYQFSQPPTKPSLTAVALDGEIRLFWDDVAETSTDPFLGQNIQDFSGYRIYKATDPFFTEVTLITDEDGSTILKKPVAIFDVVDGYDGAHPILVNGAPYNMGDESGIKNRYIDTDVINGITYYYAVTAFDTGSVTRALGPTENTTIIEVNSIGQPLFSDRNTAFVTPGPTAAGYVPPNVLGDVNQLTEGWGTGRILGFDETDGSEIVNADIIEDNQEYRVSFFSERDARLRTVTTTAYSISNISTGTENVLIDSFAWEADDDGIVTTDLFEGLILAIKNDTTAFSAAGTGWVDAEDMVTPSNKGWSATVVTDSGAQAVLPHSDIEIIFVNEDTLIAPRGRGNSKFLVNLPINFMAIAADSAILNVSVIDVDSSDAFELENDALQIWEFTPPVFRYSYWNVRFEAESNTSALGEGDVFRIKTTKEFVNGDYFDFETISATLDDEAAKDVLKNKEVAVVPNPYIFTSPLDPADPFKLGRENRLTFINTPADATIRIFTLSGKTVDKIEVDNPVKNGLVYWDLRSSEDLKVAPGIYIFHIKDNSTGEEQIGRFAIIR